MKIKVLPDTVISKIAAGEVVERPSSVVRELVDNAIDAGANRIEVRIERGGRGLIEVLDNGCGMQRDDALLAFERHATSKLTASEDIFGISTRGFRGEALPSIASVSRFLLVSRTTQQEVATKVLFEGGVLKGVEPITSPVGTRCEVRHLFYNTPARKKFLKSDKVEESRIRSWLLRSSLATPHIRFSLVADGREVLNLLERESSLERAKTIFKGSVVPFSGQGEAGSCRGVVGHPALAETDAESFIILVNGRLVVDRAIIKAVKEGFHSTLKDREFPVGFIELQIPPEQVDVNVHPQKAEVRFARPGDLYAFVRSTLHSAVSSFHSPFRGTPELVRPVAYPSPAPRAAGQPRFDFSAISTGNVAVSTPLYAPPQETPLTVEEPLAVEEERFAYSSLRYIGQALGCFLFCEYDDQVYVVDMHAAHERINYNIIRRRLREGGGRSQRLLMPEVVELSVEQMESLGELMPLLQNAGLEVEEFGESAVVVRGIPEKLSKEAVPFLIKEVATRGASAIEDRIDAVAARLACHASVRGGDLLTREEVYALFEQLDQAELGAACPHGRPVAVPFKRSQIEQWFGRDR